MSDHREPGTVSIETLAGIFDSCSDSTGQWDGAAICDWIGDIIGAQGGWSSCDMHGVYSAAKKFCPRCADEVDFSNGYVKYLITSLARERSERENLQHVENLRRKLRSESDDPGNP